MRKRNLRGPRCRLASRRGWVARTTVWGPSPLLSVLDSLYTFTAMRRALTEMMIQSMAIPPDMYKGSSYGNITRGLR